jgi:hypothetical protein
MKEAMSLQLTGVSNDQRVCASSQHLPSERQATEAIAPVLAPHAGNMQAWAIL